MVSEKVTTKRVRENDIESILDGSYRSRKNGVGSRTAFFSDGSRQRVDTYEGRMKAVGMISEEYGLNSDFNVLTNSIKDNKYLDKNRKSRDKALEVIGDYCVGHTFLDDALTLADENANEKIVGREASASKNDFKKTGEGLSGYIGGGRDIVGDKNVEMSGHEGNNSMYSSFVGKVVKSKIGKNCVAVLMSAAILLNPIVMGCGKKDDAKVLPKAAVSYEFSELQPQFPTFSDISLISEDFVKVGPRVGIASVEDLSKNSEGTVRPENYDECRGVVREFPPLKNCNTGATKKDGFELYEVVKGDTMTGIAKNCEISLEDLVKMNKGIIYDSDWIFPGDKMYVPSSDSVDMPISIKGQEVKDIVTGRSWEGENNLKKHNMDWWASTYKQMKEEWGNPIDMFDDSFWNEVSGERKDIPVEIKMKNKKINLGGELGGLYYQNMKDRSSILNSENGRAEPSLEKFGNAVSENYEEFIDEITSIDDIGLGNGKTVGRFGSMWDKTKKAGKEFAHFGSLGFYTPSHLKKEGSNNVLKWAGAPIRVATNLLGVSVDALDIPTGGIVGKTLNIVGKGAKGTMSTGLDSVDNIVGGVSALTTQPLEEMIYDDSHLTEALVNGPVGLITRFTDNVMNMEAIQHADLDENGKPKGFVGSAAEMGFTYWGISKSLSNKGDSSSNVEVGGNSKGGAKGGFGEWGEPVGK